MYKRGLRGRDWLGILFMLIPILIYLLGAVIEVDELSSPHVSWNVIQLAAVVIHVPLWVTAVVLFLSGEVTPRDRQSDKRDGDQHS